jgi:adenylate kinase
VSGGRDLVLFGPPGAGKGTQAVAVSQRSGLPHIATGDMFRAHLRDGTALGRAAREYMDRGELVPDEVTVGMLAERLAEPDAQDGFLLDGFPRNGAQAEALDGLLRDRGRAVSALLVLEVPEDELVRRITGRLVCRAASHPYHESDRPPATPGVCDLDGSELYRRDDDTEEVVRTRARVYRDDTAPVIEHYRSAGVPVRVVDGARAADAVEADLLAAIDGSPVAR